MSGECPNCNNHTLECTCMNNFNPLDVILDNIHVIANLIEEEKLIRASFKLGELATDLHYLSYLGEQGEVDHESVHQHSPEGFLGTKEVKNFLHGFNHKKNNER